MSSLVMALSPTGSVSALVVLLNALTMWILLARAATEASCAAWRLS